MSNIVKKIDSLKNNISEHWFEYLAIMVATFTLFSIIWPVIFATHDDIVSYIVVKNEDVLKTTIASAKGQGRFWFLISSFLSHFPYIFDNVVVYKLISYASICFSVSALGILLYRNVSKESAYLATLLFFAFAQLDGQHNLLVAYVFSHQIAIGLILFSMERLLYFYKTGKKVNTIYSAILLFFSTILYESFILFSIILFFITLFYTNKRKLKFKQVIYDLKFHIIFMMFYLFMYFLWKHFYPGNYDGTKIQLTNLGDSLRVLILYGLARVPLISTIFNYQTYKLSMIEPIYIIKGFIVAITVILILNKSKSLITIRFFLYSLLVCLLGIFLPVMLHSITPKYIGWVQSGSYAYLPSFYSYFFITALLSIFALLFYQFVNGSKLKNIANISIFLLVLSISILTDINNENESKKFQVQLRRYEAFDNAVSSEYYHNIEDEAVIYIPDYEGIHYNMPNMDYYSSIYSDRHHTFTNKIEELDFQRPTYGFHYDEESGSMLIGKLKENMMVDNVYIVSNDSLAEPTAIIYKNNKSVSSVQGDNSNNYGDIAILPKQINANYIEFIGEDIDLYSCYLINRVLKSKDIQSLSMGEGFYQQEMWGNDIVYWCEDIGKIILYNRYDKMKKVTITAKIASGDDAKSYSLMLSSNEIEQEVSITASQQEFSFELLLQPGENVITLNCDAPPLVTTNGDTRELVFYVMNLNLMFEEE